MKSRSAIFNFNIGSIGNMTAVPWPDGSTVFKAKIENPTNPNTLAQQAQRSKFKDLQTVAGTVRTFLREAFDKIKVTHSAYNSWMASALETAGGLATYSLLECLKLVLWTRGSLYKTVFSQVSAGVYDAVTQDLELDISWLFDSSSQNQDGNDKLCILIYEVQSRNFRSIVTAKTRAGGGAQEIVKATAGEDCIVTFYFKNENGTEQTTESAMYHKTAANTVVLI